MTLGVFLFVSSCAWKAEDPWQSAVAVNAGKLGHRNWVVISEAAYPAQTRIGVKQVTAGASVPEVLDYVLKTYEQTEFVRPRIYMAREMRAVENQEAPGIDEYRKGLKEALHGHEVAELDQNSLMTLVGDASRTYEVLLIRTQTPLPYTSVYIELQPGYWDVDSESNLRKRIQRERMQRLVRP